MNELANKYLKYGKDWLIENYGDFIGLTTELEIDEKLDEVKRTELITILENKNEIVNVRWYNNYTLNIQF